MWSERFSTTAGLTLQDSVAKLGTGSECCDDNVRPTFVGDDRPLRVFCTYG